MSEKTYKKLMEELSVSLDEVFDRINLEDTTDWVKEHPDVKIIAKTERSSDYFMKTLNENHSDVFNQFIAEVPGMTEYTGLYASILNINIGGYTPEQIIEFVEMNNVPAITMNAKSAAGKYKYSPACTEGCWDNASHARYNSVHSRKN